MRRFIRQRDAAQRSQAIVEFAIIAPVLLLLLFGIVDFGRVIYYYVTLNQAVNEGARSAIRSSAQLPTNADVEAAVRQHAVDMVLANPCPNGPITATTPPSNTENAPGGQMWGNATGSCSATNPARNHAPLQVTIRYNFVPFTPLIRQITANNIIITAAATYAVEY